MGMRIKGHLTRQGSWANLGRDQQDFLLNLGTEDEAALLGLPVANNSVAFLDTLSRMFAISGTTAAATVQSEPLSRGTIGLIEEMLEDMPQTSLESTQASGVQEAVEPVVFEEIPIRDKGNFEVGMTEEASVAPPTALPTENFEIPNEAKPLASGKSSGRTGFLDRAKGILGRVRAPRNQKPNVNRSNGGQSRGFGLPTGPVNKLAAYKIGGIIAAIVAFAGIVYFGARTSGPGLSLPERTANPNWFTAPTPNLIPLDFLHTTQPGINQIMIALCTLLIIILVIMDASQRREKSDFRTTAMAIGMLLISGLIFNWVKASFFYGFMQFSERQLKFVQILYGGFFTYLPFREVYLISIQGRRDWSPMGGLVAITAASGMLFGTKGLGSLGLFLLLPDSPAYSIPTLYGMFWSKLFSQMAVSLIIDTVCVIGTVILAREALRSVRASKPGWEYYTTIFGSTVLILGYLFGRFIAPSVHPLWIFSAASALSAVTGLQNQQETREAEDKGYSGSPVNLGEVREGRALIPPYDKLAWQVSALLLTIVLSGTV